MFELLNELKETYVMQLPAQRNERGLDLWKKEIIALKEKLEDFYGIQITEEDIKKAIRLKNRERKGHAEIHGAWKAVSVPDFRI